MLARVDELVGINADFVIETTLASLTYARKISAWRERGYIVSLAYLRLASIAESMARVRKVWRLAATESRRLPFSAALKGAFVISTPSTSR